MKNARAKNETVEKMIEAMDILIHCNENEAMNKADTKKLDTIISKLNILIENIAIEER